MARVDWDKVDQDVEWIVNAIRTSHGVVKGDSSNMFELNSDDGAYVNAVEEELERHGISIVKRSGAYVGVRG